MIDNFLNIKSIDPEYWGKSGWIFLNSIALTFKPEYRDKYREFILQLEYILPCNTCGANLKKNISTLDKALETKETFLNWLIDVRNGVYIDNNEFSKQKNINQTLNEIFYSYSSNFNIYLIISISLLVLILLIYLLHNEISKHQNI